VVSSLARVEVVRAVSSGGSRAVARARLVLDRLHELPIDRSLLDRAGLLDVSRALRSLDAIHLASALALGGTLQAVVTYDAGMAAAAEALGLEVTAPG
jgi:predicted nucleic acid-binding protein